MRLAMPIPRVGRDRRQRERQRLRAAAPLRQFAGSVLVAEAAGRAKVGWDSVWPIFASIGENGNCEEHAGLATSCIILVDVAHLALFGVVERWYQRTFSTVAGL